MNNQFFLSCVLLAFAALTSGSCIAQDSGARRTVELEPIPINQLGPKEAAGSREGTDSVTIDDEPKVCVVKGIGRCALAGQTLVDERCGCISQAGKRIFGKAK